MPVPGGLCAALAETAESLLQVGAPISSSTRQGLPMNPSPSNATAGGLRQDKAAGESAAQAAFNTRAAFTILRHPAGSMGRWARTSASPWLRPAPAERRTGRTLGKWVARSGGMPYQHLTLASALLGCHAKQRGWSAPLCEPVQQLVRTSPSPIRRISVSAPRCCTKRPRSSRSQRRLPDPCRAGPAIPCSIATSSRQALHLQATHLATKLWPRARSGVAPKS